MKRGETGWYGGVPAGGEILQAFVPAPLPLQPAIDFGGGLQSASHSRQSLRR